MTRREFIKLKYHFHKVDEAIKLYDSGEHTEYDHEQLNKELDIIHRELCKATSDLAQKLIKTIDNNEAINPEEKFYLNSLFSCCDKCRCYGECPDLYELTKEYGNGALDEIGADFDVLENNKTEFKYFDYLSFYALMEDYGLAEE